jgi:hypothetical protein
MLAFSKTESELRLPKPHEEKVAFEVGSGMIEKGMDKKEEIEELERLEEELRKARVAYVQKEIGTNKILHGIFERLGFLRTRARDISDVASARSNYDRMVLKLLDSSIKLLNEQELSPEELKKAMGQLARECATGEKIELFDVRTDIEGGGENLEASRLFVEYCRKQTGDGAEFFLGKARGLILGKKAEVSTTEVGEKRELPKKSKVKKIKNIPVRAVEMDAVAKMPEDAVDEKFDRIFKTGSSLDRIARFLEVAKYLSGNDSSRWHEISKMPAVNPLGAENEIISPFYKKMMNSERLKQQKGKIKPRKDENIQRWVVRIIELTQGGKGDVEQAA